jgi:hypothetical protein
MKIALLSFLGLAAMGITNQQVNRSSPEPLLHVRNSFQFTIHAPMKAAAPLFGAHSERAWAGNDWDPRFVYPQPAVDIAGAVFTVERHGHKATWINTAFDLENGHMQYVYFIPETLVTLIDVHLAQRDSSNTNVTVVYERTALRTEANAHVKQLGESDAKAGKEWEAAINDYFVQQKLATEKR